MKKLFWCLFTSILLLGTVSTPIQLKADGTPPPLCPPGKMGCKPATVLGPI